MLIFYRLYSMYRRHGYSRTAAAKKSMEPSMTAAHTPGPWAHYPEDNIIVASGDCKISEWQARSTNVSKIERDANARLIAAAPDLLEALEQCIEALEDSRDYPLTLGDALAAIAKATGGAQ